MSMLYMMTRFGAAKNVTADFEQVMGKKPQTFQQFVKKRISLVGNKNVEMTESKKGEVTRPRP